MFFHFKDRFPQLQSYWDKYLPHQQRLEVPSKTVLLKEGHISERYIFIEKGCIRAFFNNNGDDKTVQFFFENDGLSSLESFVNNTPSFFTIETIEPSTLYLLPRKYVMQLMDEISHEPAFMMIMMQISAGRLSHYINESLSFIRDTAEERYERLLDERPHIVQRVPQHYIASYLGVSTVHLSRIKSKLAKGRSHF